MMNATKIGFEIFRNLTVDNFKDPHSTESVIYL